MAMRGWTTLNEKVMESPYPTMNDILAASRAQNLDIRLQSLGPLFRITANDIPGHRTLTSVSNPFGSLFRITARNTGTRTELGKAEVLIRVWTGGKVLHLDSMRLRRGELRDRVFHECGCRKAELLAINDSDLYHSKLVRFYGRVGIEAVREVTGGTTMDLAHILVWGGDGTRMDADVEHLLGK